MLSFVCSLGWVGHVVGDEQADFEANVVSRQNFLSSHQQRGLTDVLGTQRKVAAPPNVPARAERLKKLALVVEQTDVAFRHEKSAADLVKVRQSDGEADDGEANKEQNFVVHACFPFLVKKSRSPGQETTVQRRGKRWRVPTKPPSGCACAPVSLLRTVYGVSPNLVTIESVISRLRIRTAIEPAHTQDQSGELSEWLLARFKLGRPTGFAPAQTPSRGVMLLLHHDHHKMEPLVGLAPTNTSLQNSSCGC